MASAGKKTAIAAVLAGTTLAMLFSGSAASANQIDTPPSGVTVNHAGPAYVVTIDCDNLPYGGQELYTGLTQRGSYTLHFEANCQDSNNYIMQVDDNGDTDEVGGYTVNGVTEASSGWIAFPATMTLKPDTYVTVKRVGGAPTDYFNIRYNGSDPNQLVANNSGSEGLSNTGFDTVTFALVGGLLTALGALSLVLNSRRK